MCSGGITNRWYLNCIWCETNQSKLSHSFSCVVTSDLADLHLLARRHAVLSL